MNKLELMRKGKVPDEKKYVWEITYNASQLKPITIKIIASTKRKAKKRCREITYGIFTKILSVTQPHKTKTYAPHKKETDFITNFINNIKTDLFSKTTK